MHDRKIRMLEAKLLSKQGHSQAQIAEYFGVTTRTIRNWNKFDELKGDRRSFRGSKLDPFREQIKARVVQNPSINCELLFDELVQQGYSGKLSILRDFVRNIKKSENLRIAVAFETLPGQQAQVDWKECGSFILNGIKTKVYAFVMVLGFSRRAYVQLVTDMKQETLHACHLMAFNHFGGVPKEILYDNMKTAFVQVESGWVPNPKLRSFAVECGFKPRRCKVYSPWTKGKVERFIGFFGNNMLQKLSRSQTTLDDINHTVKQWLTTKVDHRQLREFGQSRWDRFGIESRFLTPVPLGVTVDSHHFSKVRSNSCIVYQNVQYSVPPALIGKVVEVIHPYNTWQAKVLYNGELVRSIALDQKSGSTIMHPDDQKAIREIHQKQIQKHIAKYDKSESVRDTFSQEKHSVEVEVRDPNVYSSLVQDAA